MHEKVILASASPRRKELMKYVIDCFTVYPANIDETIDDSLSKGNAIIQLALKKAQAIHQEHGGIVIGADTLVVIENQILGKPKNEADAKRMLQMLSGKTHEVYTAIAVVSDQWTETALSTTHVSFYPLTDTEVERYIATGEPMDKAGAYGIQGQGALFAKRLDGDFYSVMGLPVALLGRILRQRGILEE